MTLTIFLSNNKKNLLCLNWGGIRILVGVLPIIKKKTVKAYRHNGCPRQTDNGIGFKCIKQRFVKIYWL